MLLLRRETGRRSARPTQGDIVGQPEVEDVVETETGRRSAHPTQGDGDGPHKMGGFVAGRRGAHPMQGEFQGDDGVDT